ncbi:MAG: hypothetical protein H0U64_12195 [Gemmatimonadaceae bacterium]|nr:hypothetical protein [Gemmatimonadaceae bacterium]
MSASVFRIVLTSVLVLSFASIGEAQMSREQKIASATAAAPAEISAKATIVDWPAKPGAEMPLIRKGSNGWVCLPSQPPSKYIRNNAMCVDKPWQAWMAGLMAGKKPNIKEVGYGYMLTNDSEESNAAFSDTVPTKTNQWHHVGAHVMVVYPNTKTAHAVSSDPHNGGPYVMYKGTPYAHVMVPLK